MKRGERSVAEMRSAVREQASLVLAERNRQFAHEKTAAASRQRLLVPIRKAFEAQFSQLAEVLIDRARARERAGELYGAAAEILTQHATADGEAADLYARLSDLMVQCTGHPEEVGEADRLIDNAVAMRRQWLPMAVYDELTVAWANETETLTRRFLRRYNLFVTNRLAERDPQRWRQMAGVYQRILTQSAMITRLGKRKNAEIGPVLAKAKEDDPEAGQFKHLAAGDFDRSIGIYRELEMNVEQFHVIVLEGLEMQSDWMDEYGYDEPGEEMAQ
jgi:hypothetical protein